MKSHTPPLLAIVIPAYKATFLRATLDSIAAQTDRRFRVYIGDDASPEPVREIVDDYSERLDIVYRRFDDNLGGRDLVAQWQRCIAMSEQERYIWLFSDDDIMESKCVEAFLSLPEETRDNALVHFDIDVIDSRHDGRATPASPYPPRLSAADYLRGKLTGRFVSYVVEFIFPRRLYEATGGFENFDLAWGSDFMTWLKFAALSPRGIVTIPGGPKVGWRMSDRNISPDKSRPVMLRKIASLSENAAFVRRLLREHPDEFGGMKPGFRWVRFPLGEIYRNRSILRYADILALTRRYISLAGHPLRASLAAMLSMLRKLTG